VRPTATTATRGSTRNGCGMLSTTTCPPPTAQAGRDPAGRLLEQVADLIPGARIPARRDGA
jgi:hypothetical protein